MSEPTYGACARKHPLPSIAELRAKYSYDPIMGTITGPSGKIVGGRLPKGYIGILTHFKGKAITIRRARLAFALHEGRWPFLVDHINRKKDDDRWENLREASQKENCWNAASRHITKKKGTEYRYGFRWNVAIATSEGYKNTSRRDFCDAWKLRQAWLTERNDFLNSGALNL